MRGATSFSAFLLRSLLVGVLIGWAGVLPGAAQTLSWQWSQLLLPLSPTSLVRVTNSGTDQRGRLYVMGSFIGQAQIGPDTLDSSAGELFVGCLDTAGTWQWVQQYPLPGQWQDGKLAISTNGTPYMLVWEPTGRKLCKLNSATGAIIWQEQAGTARGLAVDQFGNPYLTGYLQGTATICGVRLQATSADSLSLFVLKLDAAGHGQWSAQAHCLDRDSITFSAGILPESIAVDSAGYIAVAGNLANHHYYSLVPPIVRQQPRQGIFGTDTISFRMHQLFVARLSPAGTWQWVHTSDSCHTGFRIWQTQFDGAGNIYVSGDYEQPFAIDTIRFTGYSGVPQFNFYASLTPNGNWHRVGEFTARSSVTRGDFGNLVVHPDGAFSVSGVSNRWGLSLGGPGSTPVPVAPVLIQSPFIATGRPSGQWEVPLTSTATDTMRSIFGTSLSLDSNGNHYLSGFSNSRNSTFGAVPYISQRRFYGFIAKARPGFVLNASSTPTAASPHLLVWPNPARSTLRVMAPNGARSYPIELIDPLGRQVLCQSVAAGTTATLTLPSLTPGLYGVRCGGQLRRIIIE